jgi:hypothetical protein
MRNSVGGACGAVQQLDVPVAGNLDVGRLQIAMHHAAIVGVLQGFGDLAAISR